MENIYKAHIPTEQFGFIEVESNNLEDIIEKYKETKDKIMEKKLDANGFSIQKLTRIIDTMSEGSPMLVEDYESLTDLERPIIEAVKRNYKRSPLAKGKVEKRELNKTTKE